MEGMSPTGLPPLSLYVHLPWCVRKCPYCDFNSHALRGALPEDDYLAALLADLAEEQERAGDRSLETVFFGGGTPSLFGAESLGRLLAGLRERGLLVEDAEITLEANPGTIERGSFADYRDAGINRVSLGVQSFDAERLARLGRIHGPRETWSALEELDRAGIDNFNIDLMYGLPGQTVAAAVDDLNCALRAGPAHISHYQLTLEPNTLFWHRPPELPDDDDVWQMQGRCQALLSAAGYEHYEVSAYAAPGRRCGHNVNYWTYGDYLGVGAGAHGKLTLTAAGTIVRRSKRKHPGAYLAGAAARIQEETVVSAKDCVFEFMLNASRLSDGFDRRLFETRTGLDFAAVAPGLGHARRRGLMAEETGVWRPTAFGRRFLNDLQALFLPESNHD
jgi:putative oxygen-independent coproporphyrinogen III oxidase